MVTGKIKWFGGFNNQRQTRNNFGFIELEEGDIDRDIYVNRREIPQDLQILLERDNGEGVYVCFDLEENSQKFEAINVELKKYTGVVISFSGEQEKLPQNLMAFSILNLLKNFHLETMFLVVCAIPLSLRKRKL
ncbi:MAG: cold shock domain-containing protein [Okeania sp. SIO2F4]|uniref:cold shock domain-containing protein n=1 Tax=Okeania sp. SIO2F4 TaxID=2607790 RepID=UPI00142B05E3|nr:cold shock domain-containing protein [Okeania sp. SIO2F4]NES05337.1 cold shock domain-containing protein [Okeania sp. SIO2F4]